MPTQGLPDWLRVIADWNPVSAVAAAVPRAVRQPQPRRADRRFLPAQHPVVVALVWSVVIIAVCAPLASRLLRRRTTD